MPMVRLTVAVLSAALAAMLGLGACTTPPNVDGSARAPMFGDMPGPGGGQAGSGASGLGSGGSLAGSSGGSEGLPDSLGGPGSAGSEQPAVSLDDASCVQGFPPQEDPSFQRFRRLDENHPEAQAMFTQMQLQEKLAIISGYPGAPDWNFGAFESQGVARVNYPVFRMRDGPRGVRGVSNERTTTFPVAEVRAASFDLELEERIGAVVAAEMRALRVDLMLAPTINVLRHPGWARGQETYGEDPVLLGEMGAAYVRGMQAGPQGMPACPKHYAANNTDENRGAGNQRGVNAIIDEQNLRENYTRAFQIVIEKSDPACLMAAYNSVNGDACTENAHLLTDILRSQPSDPQRGFGWGGFVVSDWEATLGSGRGVLAITAGLDLEMPTPVAFEQLGAANASEIDRAARRILNARANFGQLSAEYVQQKDVPQELGIVNNESHRALTREAAEKGAVLLKNNGVLPLGSTIGGLGTPELQSIVFLGPDRDIPRIMPDVRDPHGLGDGGSSQTFPPYVVSFLSAVTERASGVQVTESANAADAAGKTVAIIPVTMAHRDEGEAFSEGGDRDQLDLAGTHPLHWTEQKPSAFINAVRAADPNVKIVVLLAVGSAVIVEDWIEAVDAIVQTFYPGQEGGNAAARLLFGDINFSGKLPFTVATDPNHYPFFGNTVQSVEFEYLHGYRRFEANGTAPRFWFGHGLSYTSYEYGPPTVLCSGGITGSGRLNVEVTVTNTGPVVGDEIVQLFVSSPATAGLTHAPPPKELKTFQRVRLQPGESRTVQLFVPARDLRHWGPSGWELATGEHTVLVGPSADPALLQSATFAVN